MLHRISLLLMFIIALTGCLGGGGNTSSSNHNVDKSKTLDTAIEQLVEYSIVPIFNDLHLKSEQFKTAADIFCTESNETSLAALQDQWKDLSLQWNRALVYQFGPMKADPFVPEMWYIESRLPTGVDESNNVRTLINNQLNATTLLDDNFFSDLSYKQVGILAAEILIFENTETGSVNSNDIINEYTNNSRKCDLLKGIAGLISNYTEYFKIAWNSDYKNEFLSGRLSIGVDSNVVLIEAAQQHLDYISHRKLKNNANQNLDAKIADYAKQNISASIAEIRQMLIGVEGKTTYSLFDHMLALQNKTEKLTVESNLEAIEAELETLPISLKGADTTTLASRMATLDGSFKRELADGLAINLSGLNFNDGD